MQWLFEPIILFSEPLLFDWQTRANDNFTIILKWLKSEEIEVCEIIIYKVIWDIKYEDKYLAYYTEQRLIALEN